MEILHRIATYELIACWAFWAVPFIWRIKTAPKRKPDLTVRQARWGLLLQSFSYVLASVGMTRDPGTARIIASMLVAPVAGLLAWTAVTHLGKQWRIEAGLYPDHELVRTGPYRFVRHPVYTSMLALLLTHALLLSRWPFLVSSLVLFLIGTEIRVRVEDAILRSRFRAEFESYRRKVPAYVPGLR